jgi:long-chain acyl-CoA synthetase
MLPMSITDLLRSASSLHARSVALICRERRWTYAELDRLTDRLAAALSARGLGSGDRLAFLLPNSPELVFTALACCKLGAVAVPLNTRLTGAELGFILEHCAARLCIADTELYPALQAATAPGVEGYIVVGATAPGSAEPFDSLLDESHGIIDWPPLHGGFPTTIIYTSGTTARPKGVTHTQASLGNTARHFIESAGLTDHDVVLGMLSMSHIFGLTLQLLSPLAAGATVVISPNVDPATVLELIVRHRVTHLYGLPVMFDSLSRHPTAGSADTGSLRYCLAGGDAVTPALSDRMRDTFGIDLYEGCGMTEVIPYALNRPASENRVGSIGRASLGMELRLIDENGQEPTAGEAGEILVRSNALMAGYWNNPEATAAAMLDGWFRTGDLGYRDQDGYYWFVGRSKEIIVRGGSKISPLEVEDVLSLHPSVGEVAVVGAPDPVLGERVVAFVSLKSDTSVTAEELKEFASGQLAPYKTPEAFMFVPALPRGTTGKVQRKTLKEWAARGWNGTVAEPGSGSAADGGIARAG